MAYFVVSEKVSNEWKILEPLKLDLRTPSGQNKLALLRETNQLVEEVPENKVGIRVYALVQGKLFWTHKLATLKTQTLHLAVHEGMSAKRLKELLTPRAHGERKGFIEERVDVET